MKFKVRANFNRNLPREADSMVALISVAAESPEVMEPRGGLAELFIIDVSTSMRGKKLAAAKQSAQAAIGCLNADSRFAVITFSDVSKVVTGFVQATEQNKLSVQQAISALSVDGGTSMSDALNLACELFSDSSNSDCVRHALFLTDGKNETDTQAAFAKALARAEGLFQLDARGVGTDWDEEYLMHMASRLLGKAQIIADPSQMEADFLNVIGRNLGKRVANARLRLWVPEQGARITGVKMVDPREEILTDRGQSVDTQTCDYPTGAWGKESRIYRVSLELDPKPPGALPTCVLMASIVFKQTGQSDEIEMPLPKARVQVGWTELPDGSELLANHPLIDQYDGTTEVSERIKAGWQLIKRGYMDDGTQVLGEAYELAEKKGAPEQLKRIRNVVSKDASGKWILVATKEQLMELGLESSTLRME